MAWGGSIRRGRHERTGTASGGQARHRTWHGTGASRGGHGRHRHGNGRTGTAPDAARDGGRQPRGARADRHGNGRTGSAPDMARGGGRQTRGARADRRGTEARGHNRCQDRRHQLTRPDGSEARQVRRPERVEIFFGFFGVSFRQLGEGRPTTSARKKRVLAKSASLQDHSMRFVSIFLAPGLGEGRASPPLLVESGAGDVGEFPPLHFLPLVVVRAGTDTGV